VRLLRPSSQEGRRVTVFERDRGVICYEMRLFLGEPPDFRMPPEVPEALFATRDLDWYWGSDRDGTVSESTAKFGLPSVRTLTRLTRATSEVLRTDLDERNVEGNARGMLALGVEAGFDPSVLSSDELSRLRSQFAELEGGPLRIVINHLSDMMEDYTFVPQHPVGPVVDLLERLGITGATPLKRRRYKSLGVVRLERQTWDQLAAGS
jgi:hypothetical protein